MKRTALAVGLLSLLVARSAGATSATCAVTDVTSINNLDLPFPIFRNGQYIMDPNQPPLVFSVEFDEQAGTFSFSRDAWATRFGPDGAAFETGFGPLGFLEMDPGTVSGTIDASGAVTLPKFAMAFATTFCEPRSPNYPIQPDMLTGTGFRFISGAAFPVTGTALDFGSGQLEIAGVDVIPDACGAGGPILSGLAVTCTLSPKPDASKLPPAPSLAKVAGKAKIGKPEKGDLLTLKTRLVDWKTIDLAGGDFYLRIGASKPDPNNPASTAVMLRVPAGTFATKGKRRVAQDSDGKTIQVLTGHKDSATGFGGTIVLATAKKGTTLAASVHALDLAALSGTETVTVVIGGYAASHDVTVSGSGKSRRLK
jgi:hypothetical protein